MTLPPTGILTKPKMQSDKLATVKSASSKSDEIMTKSREVSLGLEDMEEVKTELRKQTSTNSPLPINIVNIKGQMK